MISNSFKEKGVNQTRGSISKLSIEDNIELKIKEKDHDKSVT